MKNNALRFVFSTSLGLLLFLIQPFIANVSAATLGFEEFLPGDGLFPIAGSYGGLTWSNFYAYDIEFEPTPNGYSSSVHSGVMFAYNGAGNEATIGSGRFHLNSAYLSAGCRDNLQLHVAGFQSGILKYTNTYSLNTTNRSFLRFNYLDVDLVRFSASDGIQHIDYPGDGTSFGIDDLNVTVLNSVLITQQPTNCSALAGDTASFSVVAGGAPPFGYQWRLNGTNLPNAYQAVLLITNIQSADAGNYSVVVSNTYESVLSSNALLTVIASAPTIQLQPANQIAGVNSTITFTADVSGSEPISYQWLKNGTNVAGQNGRTLVISSVQTNSAGAYSYIASNTSGATNSASAQLTVIDYPEALETSGLLWDSTGDSRWFVETNIVQSGFSAAKSGPLGDNQQSVLQTTVTGPGTLTFWWKVGSQQNADFLSFTVDGVSQFQISGPLAWEQRTVYLASGVHTLQWIYAKDASGYGWEDAGCLDQVRFTSGGTAPIVQVPPQSQVVWLGTNATLNASVVGTPPLQYQWQFNSTNLLNATNTTLALTNVQFSQEGNYSLVISNDFGATNSTPAFLNVVDFNEAANATNLTWTPGGNKPWVAQSSTTHDGIAALQSGTITANQQSILQTTVNGPGTIGFWWKVSSETNNDFVNFSIDAAEQFRISGNVNWQQRTAYLTAGSHTLTWSYSKNASINVGSDAAWVDQVSYTEGVTAAFVSVQSTNILTSAFTNATFAPTCGGTPPLNYQWYLNGTLLLNATNPSLVLNNVQPSDAGIYSLAVTNAFGGDVSSNASLTLLSVYAWGAGRSNTLSTPQYSQSMVPTSALGIATFAGGVYHSLAIQTNGTAIGWGLNNYGQSTIPALTPARAAAAGLYHSLLLRTNGTVAAWGDAFNSSFATTVPQSATNVTAIASGWYHGLALRSNGTVVAWGAGTSVSSSPHFGQSRVPTNLPGVTAVAAGTYHSVALTTNGTVIAWGLNASGQTNVPIGLSNVVAIAAGGSNSVALKNDGTIVAWGDNTYGQTNIPAGLTNVSAIAVGAGHLVAIKMDGTVAVWGGNNYGQTNLVAGLTNINAVAAGGYHTLALLNFGPIALLNQPWNQTVFKGSPATFKIGVSGTGPISYQWQFNSTNLPGQTNQWLSISNPQLTDSGLYRLIAMNSYGAVTSSPAILTVNDTVPFFAPQPQNVNVVLNSNAVLSAGIGGIAPFNYQWRFNGTNLPGKTNLTLSIANAKSADEGFYSLVASNSLGYAISSNAYLNVIDLADALNITNITWMTSTNPVWYPITGLTHDGFAAVTVNIPISGRIAQLSTTVTGPGTLKFWWNSVGSVFPPAYYNFALDGLTQSSYSGSGWKQQTIYLGEGVHSLEWLASNQGGLSFTPYLDEISFDPVPTPPLFLSIPADRTVAAGHDITFSATMGGTPPQTNQWLFNGSTISGVNGTSLTLTNVQPGASGTYTLIVSNAYGITNTAIALTVTNSQPYILTHPANVEMVRNGNAFFSVSARGSDPLSYQWQFNQVDIAGATNATLVVPRIQTNDAGMYQVAISNAFGSVISSNASLTLVPTVIVGWGSVFTSSPNPPAGLTNVAAISAGEDFSVALRTDGTLYAWGWNAFSKLSIPAGLSNVVAVSAGGMHGSALRDDGTLVDWGDTFFDAAAAVPAGLSNVIQTAAGYRFNIALKKDQTIVVWGDNFLGPLNVPSDLTNNVVSAAAGQYHGLVLRQNGTLAAWGYGAGGQTNVPSGLSNVVGIAAGYNFNLALQQNGSIATWGSSGATNVPSDSTNIVSIEAGYNHALALKKDGTVLAWGVGAQTNIPFWLTNVVAISGGSTHSLALLNDGTPYIVRHPWDLVVWSGTDVHLDTVALGQPLPTYQWQFSGTDLIGATNASLVLTNVSVTQGGNYRCIVSNALGSVSTRLATLSVLRTTPQFNLGQMHLNGNGAFQLLLSGASGHGNIVLYASTNLMNWEPVFTNPPIVGDLLFNDSSATNYLQRFYRFEEQ